jgi:WD40 repeat protein
MTFEKPDFHLKPVRVNRVAVDAQDRAGLGRRELLFWGLQIPAIFAMLGDSDTLLASTVTAPRSHSSPILTLAMSSDGARVASGSSEGFKLWNRNVSQREPVRISTLAQEVCALAFSPDSSVLACGLRGGGIEMYKVSENQVIKGWTGHASKDVTGLAFSKDGRALFSAGKDGSVSVWSVATQQLQQRQDGGGGPAFSIAVSQDGRWAAAAFERSARLYAVKDGNSLEPVGAGVRDHTNTISDVEIANADRLATGSYDKYGGIAGNSRLACYSQVDRPSWAG